MLKPSRAIFNAPALFGVVLLGALCANTTWWVLHLSAPSQRALAAPPASPVQTDIAATASLFGRNAAPASNFQLKGIVFAPADTDSVAIVAADGKTARAVRIDSEIGPGVRLLEIHADRILLSDNGVQKQVMLPPPPKPTLPPSK